MIVPIIFKMFQKRIWGQVFSSFDKKFKKHRVFNASVIWYAVAKILLF